jgi:hypothetical protein
MAKKRHAPGNKPAKQPAKRLKANALTTTVPSPTDMDIVLSLIAEARSRVFAAINSGLISLYWSIGEFHQPQDRQRRMRTGNR